MTCKCGKPLQQRLVAVKTRQVGDDLLVLESKDAMVCDELGVVAWGRMVAPYQPTIVPGVPTPKPYIAPWVPNITWGSGGTAAPGPWPRPQNYC